MNILKTITDIKDRDRICRDGFNQLTVDMQDYFDGEFMQKDDRTYVFDPHEPQERNGRFIYPLRHPGSTIGHIEVDGDGIIFDIQIYETYMAGKSIPNTAGPYTLEVREMVKKYIGWKYECVEIDFNKVRTIKETLDEEM